VKINKEFGYKFRQRPLDGKTIVCGTLADPVDHTASPQFQGAAYEELGLNIVYVPFNVKAENIGDAIRGIRALNIRGVNVTMPHKMTSMEFIDDIDPLAKNIGSINGIINTNGILKGYCFDAAGFMLPFEGMDLRGKKILQLGAGGGGRASAFGLTPRGVEMIIMNRNVDKAKKLAEELSAYSGNPARAVEFTPEALAVEMKTADVFINTTSIGFGDRANETPVPQELIRSDMMIYDIVFDPIETRLLKEAKARGAKTINGLYMYVGQGAEFFEKVTGQKAPFSVMFEAAKIELGSRK